LREKIKELTTAYHSYIDDYAVKLYRLELDRRESVKDNVVFNGYFKRSAIDDACVNFYAEASALTNCRYYLKTFENIK
jgi:hypothetical protein